MQGTVVDRASGLPMSGVSIALFDDSGHALTGLGQTGADGSFFFQPDWVSNTLLAAQLTFANNQVFFYKDGYHDQTVLVGQLGGTVYMDPLDSSGPPEGDMEPAVINPNTGQVVTPLPKPKPVPAGNAGTAILVVAAAGIGGAYLLAKKRKKAGKKVSGFLDTVPTWAKVATLGFGAYVIWDLFLRKDNANSQLGQDAATDLKTLHDQGIDPTITATQAEDFASTIVTAANDCGTDEDAMYAVMQQLQNQADVLFLIQTYGVRQYKGCFDGDYFSYHSYNLAQTLTTELSGSELAHLNSILSSKGIAYQF